jgi:hypothetical protein
LLQLADRLGPARAAELVVSIRAGRAGCFYPSRPSWLFLSEPAELVSAEQLCVWNDVKSTPETWARRAYCNLICFHEVDRDGHFAAWEQPELFSAELRAAFRSLREAH